VLKEQRREGAGKRSKRRGHIWNRERGGAGERRKRMR